MSRPYRSIRRDQAAELTRRTIVDAARRVFAERGFAGATIAAIAAAAEVAVPTVYASVGGKSALLMALQEHIDQQSDTAGTQSLILSTTDALEILRIAVDLTRRINEQFADIIVVWDAAAAFEPDAAAAFAEGMRRHREGLRAVAERLHALGALRADVDVDAAADSLGILTGFRTWHTLVQDFGWSWAKGSTWIQLQLQRALLAKPASRARR